MENNEKSIRERLIEGRYSTKIVWLMILLTVIVIFSISFGSAFEIDNVKSYDSVEREITIKNAFGIPLFGNDIAKIKLISSPVENVNIGEDVKVAEFLINNFDEGYNNAFKEFEFYNLRKGFEKQDREFNLKYGTSYQVEVNDYENICSSTLLKNGSSLNNCNRNLVGSHLEERYNWLSIEESTLRSLPLGNIRVGVFTEVKAYDKVEWIPNLFGIRINEWAEFEEGITTCVQLLNMTTVNISGNFFLSNSIDCSSDSWTSIGSAASAFLGTLDGRNFSIENITDEGRSTSTWGIFGKLDNAGVVAVKDLVLRNITFEGTGNTWGALVGHLATGTIIQFISGINLTVDTTAYNIGGLVGNLNGEILDSYTQDLILNCEKACGGIGGSVAGGGKINRSYSAAGTITATGEANREGVGGVAGAIIDDATSRVAESWASNSVFGAGTTEIGIVVGDIDNGGDIENLGFFDQPGDDASSCTNDGDTGCTEEGTLANYEGDTADGTVPMDIWSFPRWFEVIVPDSYPILDEIDNSVPSTANVTLIVPSNNTLTTVNSFNFTANLTATGLLNNTNATISIWNSTDDLINETTNIVTGNETNQTTWEIFNFADGNYTWDVFAWFDNGTFLESNWSTNGNYTFFIDSIVPDIEIILPINNTNSTNANLDINYTASDLALNSCWYSNDTMTVNITLSGCVNITTLTWGEGQHNVTIWANDSLDNENSSSVTFFIDSIIPIVNATSPIGDQGTFIINRNLSLNWTAIDTNLDTCWFDYGGVNTTITCGNNETNLTVTDSTLTSVVVYANDSIGNEGFNSTSWSYSFIENNVTFNENSSETSSQFFELNLSTALDVLSISSQLNFNGTNHISQASCGDGICIVNNTIDIPLLISGESGIRNFFWDISIFNGTESINVNTTTRQQNNSRIHLEVCNAEFVVQSLNFSTYDEQNLSRLSPFTFNAAFDQWLGSGGVKRNTNFTNSSATEQALCTRPVDTSYFIDAQIDYNDASNETIYDARNYFFQNSTITNVSEDIFLYLLESSSATSFILKIQDNNLLPLEGFLVVTERYYPGENIFRIVQIGKTSTNGKTIGFFETETVDYRFLIKNNDLTRLTTLQQLIVGEVAPFTITFTIGEDLGKPWATLDPLTELDFTLGFNKTSNITTYTYIDTSGNFSLATLIIERQNFSDFSTSTILCNVNSSQSSATLSCDLSGNDTGTYTSRIFITRDGEESLIQQTSFVIETFLNIVGFLGVFLAWFLILISAFAFRFNEIAGIFVVNATIIFVNLIGLVSFGMLSISALLVVSIIIVAVLKK